jgi:hypothetical protein
MDFLGFIYRLFPTSGEGRETHFLSGPSGIRNLTGSSDSLHNEELRDLYSSPNIIRMSKSKRMRWAGHVAGIGEKKNAYRL